VLEAIPGGWRRPASTGARIEYLGRSFVGPGYSSSGRTIVEPIRVGGVPVGRIEVGDTAPGLDDLTDPFLAEEVELLRNIAARLGEFLEWKHTELFGERVSTADHWRWRQRYAESLAANLDGERFGVECVFVGGSTESGDAGPGSDIDLYVVCRGSDAQRRDLALWLEGWSLCLAEFALQQTGYTFSAGILNVHWLERPPDPWRRPDLRQLALAGG
jgi:hypothetical protein